MASVSRTNNGTPPAPAGLTAGVPDPPTTGRYVAGVDYAEGNVAELHQEQGRLEQITGGTDAPDCARARGPAGARVVERS
jgi:hypothetical protein